MSTNIPAKLNGLHAQQKTKCEQRRWRSSNRGAWKAAALEVRSFPRLAGRRKMIPPRRKPTKKDAKKVQSIGNSQHSKGSNWISEVALLTNVKKAQSRAALLRAFTFYNKVAFFGNVCQLQNNGCMASMLVQLTLTNQGSGPFVLELGMRGP